MLQQGLIQLGDSYAFIDNQSDLCIDGKPCDSNGCLVYEVNGKRIRERDFKDYRRFSPQFRQQLIEDYFRSKNQNPTMISCSCSKCGTVQFDEMHWL